MRYLILILSLLLFCGVANAGQVCDDLSVEFKLENGKYYPVLIMTSNGKTTDKIIRKVSIAENDPVDLGFEKKILTHMMTKRVRVNNSIEDILKEVRDNLTMRRCGRSSEEIIKNVINYQNKDN